MRMRRVMGANKTTQRCAGLEEHNRIDPDYSSVCSVCHTAGSQIVNLKPGCLARQRSPLQVRSTSGELASCTSNPTMKMEPTAESVLTYQGYSQFLIVQSVFKLLESLAGILESSSRWSNEDMANSSSTIMAQVLQSTRSPSCTWVSQ